MNVKVTVTIEDGKPTTSWGGFITPERCGTIVQVSAVDRGVELSTIMTADDAEQLANKILRQVALARMAQ